MVKGEYKEFLKDGRWQRKRLEIMKRDGFKCKQCGATNDLHVHHLRYFKGRKPWEYSNEDLVTLCGKCHSFVHEYSEESFHVFFDKKNFELEHKGFLKRAKSMCWKLSYYKRLGVYQNVLVMLCRKPNGGYFIPFLLQYIEPNGTVVGLSSHSNVRLSTLIPNNVVNILYSIHKYEPDYILNDEESVCVSKRIKNKDVSHIIDFSLNRV